MLAIFFVLLAVGAAVFRPAQRPGAFVACAAILSAALVVVCYATGEPPRWRWGKK